MSNLPFKPTTITAPNGKTLYLRPDGSGYETSKVRRNRRTATTKTNR